jgi:gluconokinase
VVIILMGPTASGKTTVGQALASALGWPFIEGDALHSSASVEKMRSGQSLSDTDRKPWLAAIRGAIVRALDRREHAVVACSALKQRYRTQLSAGLRGVRFVYLSTPPSVLAERAAIRHGHFAGPQLIPSQLAALETPDDALTVDATAAPAAIVGLICHEFGLATR